MANIPLTAEQVVALDAAFKIATEIGGFRWTNVGEFSVGGLLNDVVNYIDDGTFGPIDTTEVKNGTTSVLLKSYMADGGAAVGHILDTSTAWSNATAKLLSIRTNGSEKGYMLANGRLMLATTGDTANPMYSFAAYTHTGMTATVAVAGDLALSANSGYNYLYIHPTSGGITSYTNGAGGFNAYSFAADGATSRALTVDTDVVWANASARLLTIKNDSVEKAFVDVNGNGVLNGVFVGARPGSVGENTAVGASALATNSTGNQNVAVGNQASTSGNSSACVAIGYKALFTNSNGDYSTAIGWQSQRLANGTVDAENTSVGYGSFYSLSTGSFNSGVGSNVLGSLTTGTNNTAIGYNAGVTAVGANATTVADYNTFLGANSGASVASATDLQYATAVGAGATVGTDGTVVLGRAGDTVVLGRPDDPFANAYRLIVGGAGASIWTAGSIVCGNVLSANSGVQAADAYDGLQTIPTGAGYTTGYNVRLRRTTLKLSISYVAWAAANAGAPGLTQDITIGVIPAKARVVSVIADTTSAFAGTGITNVNLRVGHTAGGQEYILDHDVLAATVTKGLVDGDLGTSINRANAVQGGHIPSWSATTNLTARLITVGGNITALTAGSTAFYVEIECMA